MAEPYLFAASPGFLYFPNPQDLNPEGSGARGTWGTGGHSRQFGSAQLAPEHPRKLSSALTSLSNMAVTCLAGLLPAVKASASYSDVLQVCLARSGRLAALVPAGLI